MAQSGPRDQAKINLAIGTTVVLLAITLPRRSRAEDLADFKAMYYMEDDDRIQVFSPTFSYQRDLSSTLTIKIDGIYNSISGATPTGAPPSQGAPAAAAPAPVYSSPASSPAATPTPAPSFDDDDDEEEADDDERALWPGRMPVTTRLPYSFRAGATPTPAPAPAPAPSPAAAPASSPRPRPAPAAPTPTPAAASPQGQIPMAEFSDERYAGNVELIKKIANHAVSGLLSYSTESDYESAGVALKDTIDFNQKNTALTLGGAYSRDSIEPANGTAPGNKNTVDLLVGLTQLLDPRTLLTIDFTVGQTSGLLTDPYKVVELNGDLVAEKRPDSKNKQILFLSLAHYFPRAYGSLEGSYRYYTDGFGIDAHTAQMAWFQKLGAHWILQPQVRYYDQSQADFYAVRFAGAPEFYSSDYRVSALNSLGGGLKLVWTPNSRFQIDAEYMRHEQSGKDGVTADAMYPAANVFIAGARIWF